MFAVGAKLRQVGPIMFASVAYCIVELPPVLYRGGGEKCLQSQVFVTRPWCGPGGYIQVGMRGCEPSGDPRAVRSVPPFALTFGNDFCLLSRLPDLVMRWGREIACATTFGGRRRAVPACLPACSAPLLLLLMMMSMHPSIQSPIRPPLPFVGGGELVAVRVVLSRGPAVCVGGLPAPALTCRPAGVWFSRTGPWLP